eukprot:403355159
MYLGVSSQQTFTANCHDCFISNSYNSMYCPLNTTMGYCCQKNSTDSKCQSLYSYCLNTYSTVSKCGGVLELVPANYSSKNVSKSVAISSGAVQYTKGEVCMWWIKGNQYDATTGVNLTIQSISQMEVQILSGKSIDSAINQFVKVKSVGTYNVNFANNTYIFAVPIKGQTSGTLKLFYSVRPNVFNLTLTPESYFAQVQAIATSDNSSAQVILVACLFGILIVLILIGILVWLVVVKVYKEREMKEKLQNGISNNEHQKVQSQGGQRQVSLKVEDIEREKEKMLNDSVSYNEIQIDQAVYSSNPNLMQQDQKRGGRKLKRKRANMARDDFQDASLDHQSTNQTNVRTSQNRPHSKSKLRQLQQNYQGMVNATENIASKDKIRVQDIIEQNRIGSNNPNIYLQQNQNPYMINYQDPNSYPNSNRSNSNHQSYPNNNKQKHSYHNQYSQIQLEKMGQRFEDENVDYNPNLKNSKVSSFKMDKQSREDNLINISQEWNSHLRIQSHKIIAVPKNLINIQQETKW